MDEKGAKTTRRKTNTNLNIAWALAIEGHQSAWIAYRKDWALALVVLVTASSAICSSSSSGSSIRSSGGSSILRYFIREAQLHRLRQFGRISAQAHGQ
jgi:hypothetical protein